MVGKRKKKYEAGEGAQFISRSVALKKLQLTLRDFRKLCILKGIYPREPLKRKRAQKGDVRIKTLYHKKDIQFLLHEPIIWKLRDYKIFHKRVGRAKAMRDFETMNRYLQNHPTLTLDHIVKERYPTFIDAIRDLDDCLTLCFLFSHFPSMRHVTTSQAFLCKRLTVEFLHYVIEAKALRKVFVSIKGYYYQAEVKGQSITWIVPHHFAFDPPDRAEIDVRIMSTFVEFYTVMLGFVNFRLYHSLNLYYPPKFPGYTAEDIEKKLVDEESYVSERISALNLPLARSVEGVEEEFEVDEFLTMDDPTKLEEAKQEAEKVKKLKTLFKGLKFYLNREVPREPLVFVIRCFGGEVSWDPVLFVGATYEETDETITHHIVDRPTIKQFLSRDYVQPQWVFDSVNTRELLPVEKYFLGAVLPPHLSPFVVERSGQYMPPEERALRNLKKGVTAAESEDEFEFEEEAAEVVEDDGDEEPDVGEDTESEEEEEAESEDEEVKDITEKLKNKEQKEKKKLMAVTAGKVTNENRKKLKRQEKKQYKLREKMVIKKHRNLYKSMIAGRKKRNKEVAHLQKKRRLADEAAKQDKKLKRKMEQEALSGHPVPFKHMKNQVGMTAEKKKYPLKQKKKEENQVGMTAR